MGKEFLHDLNIHGAGQIQFKTTAGSNAGKIDQSGNDLVLSNAVGDIIIGNGSDDVFIGDGTNTVDIRFEQNMAIFADSSSTRTLTLGGANTSLVLESPTVNGSLSLGATTINQNLIFTTANGHIVFDHETTDTGEYGTEVALLKIDVDGTEKTILSRVSKQGALALGTDDTVAIVAGDTKSVIKANHNYANENIVFASEGGFTAYGFPGNDTGWSNRNVFQFSSTSTTASNNGLFLGDGGATQFIDLQRNLKNIGNITLTGDISTPGQINLPGDGTTSSFETLIYAHGSRSKLMKQGNAVFWQVAHGGNQFEITDCANDNSAKGNVLLRVSGQDADDNKLMLVPDGGNVVVSGNITLDNNSKVVSARKFTARDANGVMLTADDATSGLSIGDDGNAVFTGSVTADTMVINDTDGTRGIFRNDAAYDLRLGGGVDKADGAYISLSGGTRGGGTSTLKGRVEIFAGGDNYTAQSQITGDIVIGAHWSGGDQTILHLDSSNSAATFSGDVLPATDNSKDLGSSSYRWQNVVAVNLHGDGSNITNVGNADTVDNLHASSFLRSDGSDTANGKITFSQNAATIALAGTNHTYIEYYKTGTGNGRSAYLGFGSASSNNFNIANEISSGKVVIDTNGGSVEINDNTTVSGTLTVTGNLDITGDINSTSVNNLDVVDKLITLGKGQTEASSNGSGIFVDGSSASLLWDETNNTWDFNKSLDVVGNINASGSITSTGITISTDNPLITFTDSSGSSYDWQTRYKDNIYEFLWGGGVKFYFNNNSTLRFGDRDGGQLTNAGIRDPFIKKAGSTTINSVDIGHLQLGTNNTTQLTIDAAGNATFASKVIIPQTSTTIGGSNLGNASLLIGSTTAGIGIDTNEIVSKGDHLYIGTATDGKNIIFRTDATSAALTLDSSQNATFAGEVLVPSGDFISWGTSGYSAIEGSTVSNNLKLRTNNTVALTLDSSQNATFASNVVVGNDLYVPNEIYHTGDTDTSIRFPAEDQFRVVTGGGNRLQVENTKIQVGDDVNMNYDNISTSNSGTVVYGGFLNPASEANMVHIPHIINDLAGFNKWSNATITTSGFYKSRSGSSGSYTYSNEVQANDSGWANAFDAHSSTAGSWYSDNGSDGVYTHGTDTPGVVELQWTNEATYSLWAGIVFGSGSFTATYVKIEAYRGGAWQTLCEITNNTDQVILRQVGNNSGTGSATTRLKYTLGGSVNNSYFRIHSLYMANYRAGDNNLNNTGTNTTRGVNFLERYKDGYLHGHLFPGADDTYDLGGNSYKWKNAYFDGVVYADRVQSEGTFPQHNIIDTPNGGGSSRTLQLGMSGDTLYFKKSDATGSVIFRNTNNTNLMTIGLADSGQVTVLNELEAGSLDINGNADISGTATFGGDIAMSGRLDGVTDIVLGEYIYHQGDSNTYLNFQNNDEFRIVIGGSEKIHFNTSRIRINDDLHAAADSSYDIGTSSVRFANIYADTLYGDGSNLTNLPAQTDNTKLPLAGGTMTGDLILNDNVKANFGNSNDLQIFHAASGIAGNSFIDNATGDLTIRNTADNRSISILTDNGSGSTTTYVKANGLSGAAELYHYGSKKFETTATGISVTGDISVSGDIKGRSVPMVIHGSFDDTTSSTSNLIIPLAGSITETTVSGGYAPHFFTIPYACVLKRVIMKTVAGSQSSSFTTELKAYKNGSVTGDSSSGELTHSNSSITWNPTAHNDITYAAGDKFSLVYQKSATSKYWQDVAITIVFTLTGYDI